MYESLFKFLFDSRKKLSHKASLVILTLALLLFLDNYLGFTYYYEEVQRISAVNELNQMVNSKNSDSATVNFALRKRQEVIERTNWLNSLYITLFQNGIPVSNKDKISEPYSKQADFWFHSSAGGILYLLGFLIIPLMFFSELGGSTIIQRLGMGILVGTFLIGMGFFFVFLCSQIPIISYNNLTYNYLINIGVQVLLLVGFRFLTMKIESETSSKNESAIEEDEKK